MKADNAYAIAVMLASGLPKPTPEYRFDSVRRWRFDFSWPDHRVALEVEGGIWNGGRHTRGAGFLRDMEKYNAATLQGWRIYRTTPDALLSRETMTMIRAALLK